ncbi:MAG: response regulator [Caldilineaceae bacterium]
MLDRARVLILEDDLLWIETLSDILQPTDIVQPKVQYLQAATNLSNAFELLHRDYFNLAIVDISLVPGNDADSQGMRFLAYLQETGLDEAVSTIMLSAYGNIASVSSSFRDFQVSDFLVKGEFSRTVLIEAIQRALTKSKRDTAPQIEISRRRQIPDLWQRFNWPTREDEAQLTAELQDLLTRLFPGAQHLFLDDMPTGQSGAGVLRVTPTYEAAVGTPVVVKFGKRDKIQIERENYLKHIERFAGNHSSTQLTAAGGRAMAAITYSFIGTELENVKSFAEFYHANDVAAIERAIDNLFRKTCSRWYDGHERLRQIRNLVYLYESGLNIDWAEVWENAAFTVQDIAQPRLAFPGIAGDFENPRLWLEAQANEINMQVWRCVTHGDLNQNNVLVTDDGRCWLIDFYRQWGRSHFA